MDLPPLPPEIAPLLYLVGLGVVLSIVYAVIDYFSVDRVLKLVRGTRAFVFIGGEVHYGRLHIPPRSGGGFEVFYEERGLEHLETLLAFYLENYRETGDEKFIRHAEKLLEYFKEQGLLPPDYTLERVEVNPWAPPSLVSRKVYPGELKDLWMILSFVDFMDEGEKRARWRRLARIYSPSLHRRLARKIENSLSYVKDKVAATLAAQTKVFVGAVPGDLAKTLEEAEKKIVSGALAPSYDALLENSIGRLVTVKFKDVEGEEKLYQGVLCEYSGSYIYVMDVDYRLQLEAVLEGGGLREARPVVSFHGFRLNLEPRLRVEEAEGRLRIANAWDRPVKLEKIEGPQGSATLNRVLRPGEAVETQAVGFPAKLSLEAALEADIVWPRSRATVVGLGDYPVPVLRDVLKTVRRRKR